MKILFLWHFKHCWWRTRNKFEQALILAIDSPRLGISQIDMGRKQNDLRAIPSFSWCPYRPGPAHNYSPPFWLCRSSLKKAIQLRKISGGCWGGWRPPTYRCRWYFSVCNQLSLPKKRPCLGSSDHSTWHLDETRSCLTSDDLTKQFSYRYSRAWMYDFFSVCWLSW